MMARFAAEGGAFEALPPGDFLPGQVVVAIADKEGRRTALPLRWGLIPGWATDPAIGRKLFNARAETLSEKPSFKEAFRSRRCLIPADGFYEWTGEKGKKQAVRFGLRSGEPFAMAGLYETWRAPSGETIGTCTIVTTEPNDLIALLHDRMPVLLPKDKEALWLDPKVRDPEALRPLLVPYRSAEMVIETAAPHPPPAGPARKTGRDEEIQTSLFDPPRDRTDE